MGLARSKHEAFWEACGFGAAHKVRKFIDEGIVNVNWVSYTHNSCAIHVASQGKKEIVKMLIEAKCDVNVLDDRGNLPLHHAAMKGHAEIMQMLLDAGSKIDTQDINGWSSLINAGYWCQPDAVEVLLKNKCDPHLLNKDERNALHETCRSQSEDQEGLGKIAQMLIEAGSNINLKSSDLGEADFTPLMFSAYHGHPMVAQALIDGKCDITAQGSNKWTALHWAADRGNKDLVHILLAAGVDPLTEGRRGELALDRAQNNEIKEILRKATDEARSSLEDAARELQDEIESSEPKIMAEKSEKEKDEKSSSVASSHENSDEEDGIEKDSSSQPSAEHSAAAKDNTTSKDNTETIAESEKEKKSASDKELASGDEEQGMQTEACVKTDKDESTTDPVSDANQTQNETHSSKNGAAEATQEEESQKAQVATATETEIKTDTNEVNEVNETAPNELENHAPNELEENVQQAEVEAAAPSLCQSNTENKDNLQEDINNITEDTNALEVDSLRAEAEESEDKDGTVSQPETQNKDANEDHDDEDEMFDENAFNEGDYTDDLRDNLSN